MSDDPAPDEPEQAEVDEEESRRREKLSARVREVNEQSLKWPR